ncbi:MAG: DUF998 domain-containing protein [Bacteroidales bacterium]|nr:DUF998 domain-containing protein [Bacteroidales bacterium]
MKSLISNSENSWLLRVTFYLSVFAPLYYILAAIAVHFLRPDYTFFKNYISDYAVGRSGIIYTIAYIITALGTISLYILMIAKVKKSTGYKTGGILLILFGITYLLTAIFPTDILAPGSFPTTISGKIHMGSAIAGWFFFIIGAILLTKRIKKEPEWDNIFKSANLLTILCVVFLISLFVVNSLRLPYAGLAEKLYILSREIWLLLFAIGIKNINSIHKIVKESDN